jgi:glycosyltransferase involved in cell wall biosynthesis
MLVGRTNRALPAQLAIAPRAAIRHGTMLRMRILHLVGRSQRRGAELVALDLAHALDALGDANVVLACAPAFDGAVDPALPTVVRRVAMDPIALAATAWQLRRHLRELRPDVVLAHGGWAVQVVAIASPRRGPIVVWQRILGFSGGVTRGVRRRWWRVVCRRVDAAVALAPMMERELRAIGYAGPVWTIANFRRPDRFIAVDRARANRALRAELSIPPGTALLGLVGHLIEQKRPERALDVLTRVRATGAEAHLIVAGTGPLESQLVTATHEQSLAPFVHVLGHRDDVESVLGAVDVLLLTSQSEGIPGIVIEAQMTGCPVVTYPVGAVASVVDDGRTGIVVPRPEPQLMADAVVRLLKSPEILDAFGREGRRRAEQFSTTRAAMTYRTHFDSLRQERVLHEG